MKLTDITQKYKLGDGCVGVFGCFDGVHTGHAELIRRAVKHSQSLCLPTLVWALSVDRKDLLSSEEDKLLLLSSLGVDAVISEDYESIKELSCTEFLSMVKEQFGVSDFFCGYNFTFGKDRQGNTENITELCNARSMRAHIMPEYSLLLNGKPIKISSSCARSAIKNGDTELAAFILGRRIEYKGIVTPGEAIGRKLGFPTANIVPDERLIQPRLGVYATIVECDGRRYPALTNIGIRPTFGGAKVLIESYITSGEKNIDLYGRNITVTLLGFIRGEKKCSCPERLKKQIEYDLTLCGKYTGKGD